MAGNTIMTAKNTFGDGLLMDLAPDNTPATCLSNALNATLLTMNGNEFSLQNDMGNGRVETAYLPEGYVPVGTCEFGGIIYIVSYNPIINKSQIGCFPSPERNISSEEIQGTQTQFDLGEFIKTNNFGFKEVVSNSIKKVIYQNNLNPGDKFIVHSGDICDNMSRISDYGNESHIVGTFPKQFKVSVVAIEDSGKINYLNSTLKWYNDYYINPESTDNKNKPDLSTYRNILNSGYSVFQSKVSGKLAILIELERIQGFSSTYEIYNQEEAQAIIKDIKYQNYSIYTNFNWNTDNPNINPVALVAYDFQWLSNYSGAESLKKAGKYEYQDSEGQIHKGEMGKEFLGKDQYIKIPIYKEEPPKSDLSTNSSYKYFKEYLDYNEIIKKYTKVKKITQQRNDGGIPQDHTYWKNLHHIIIKGNNKEYYDSDGNLLKKEPDNNVQSEKEDNIVQIDDFIINNYFKQSISRKLFDISIPYKDEKENIIDQKDLILSFKIAPMMEYGALVDLAQTHYIDFSKIGSGEINLEGYKYYIGENLCTLQLDSSIYPEENKGVAGIELQFYDNQGLCATYNINNRVSYSGVITEYIPLNGDTASYKLSSTKSDKTLINHAGQVFTDSGTPSNVDTTLTYVYLEKGEGEEGDKITPKAVTFNGTEFINEEKKSVAPSANNPIFYNDAGILYSNMLYAVKIIYKYTNKNVLGEYDLTNTNSNKVEWRWLWTNTMFNQYYYNVKDFKDNQFELTLDVGAQYYANFKTKEITGYEGSKNSTSDVFKGLGLNLSYINNGEIQYTVDLGLQNTYNSFSLKEDPSTSKIPINVYSGNSYIQIQEETQDNVYLKPSNDNIIPNNINKKYEYIINKQGTDTSGIANPWDSKDAYKNYKPLFTSTLDSEGTLDTIEYIGNDSKSHNSSLGIKSTLAKLRTKQSLKINLVNPTLYIKTYTNQPITYKEVINLIQKGYEEYGLTLENNSFNFNYVYSLWVNDSGGHSADKKRYLIKWNQDKTLIDINKGAGDLDYYSNHDYLYDDELNNMIKVADSWQIRKSKGLHYYSIWKNNEQNFFRDYYGAGSGDQNDGASFTLPNGFFINLLNFGQDWTYISKTNDINNGTRDKIFSNNDGFKNSNIHAQLAFNYNGDIHLLNDYINLTESSNNNQTLKTALKGLASTWAGWLANTYTLSQTDAVYSLQLDELIYSNSVTTFTKDIVYCTKITSNNSQLLLNNYDYSKYLRQIQKYSDNTFNSNVNIQFNNVTKNIPIQIQLKPLVPIKSQQSQNITIKPFADRTFDNVYLSNIDANNLYFIQNNIMIPINNNQEIQALTSYNESTAVFSKNKYKFSIPQTFIYQNESLIPKKSSPAGSQIYAQVFTGSGNGGVIKDLLISDTILVDAKHIK